MTIHQSKGLEFPLVVVPDLERRHHAATATFAFHPSLGPLVKMPSDGEESAGCTGFDMHRLLEDEEDAAERLRLLYVATTRAADYLLLSAGVKKLDAANSPWMQLLARRFDLGTGACRAALPGEESKVPIRVTRAEPPLEGPGSGIQPRRLQSETIEAARAAAAEGRGAPPPLVAAIPPDLSARRQYSFSRLHGTLKRSQPESPAADEGLPAAAADFDPLELGTLVHDALAFAPLRGPYEAERLVRRRAARRPGTSPADVEETIRLLERFFHSPRAVELASARQVRRELEFLLAWPPAAEGAGLFPEPAGDTFLQGFIDCLYQDAGGAWHVLDYKTNRIGRGGVAAAAAPYEMQMLVYALAVEKSLGQAPKSLTLHFLRPGEEHAFAYDKSARRRLEKLVQSGIEAALSGG